MQKSTRNIKQGLSDPLLISNYTFDRHPFVVRGITKNSLPRAQGFQRCSLNQAMMACIRGTL